MIKSCKSLCFHFIFLSQNVKTIPMARTAYKNAAQAVQDQARNATELMENASLAVLMAMKEINVILVKGLWEDEGSITKTILAIKL